MRLAFFSPLPPAPTGIADYSIDVLHALASHHAIDVFHDQPNVDAERLPPSVRHFPAAELDGLWQANPYDLAIYQMGNGAAHQYVYPFLARRSGLLVLHDLVLHHSRAQAFLDSPEARAYAALPSCAERRRAAAECLDRYRAEVEYSYPGRGARIADAQLGTSGVLLPYAYPLFRLPVEASRLVACHNDFMVAAVRADVPESDPVRIPMMTAAAPVPRDHVRALRGRLGIGDDEIVVGSFGLLTREKRIETVARAVARAAALQPRLRLLLVGPLPGAAALERQLREHGVADRTIVTGRVPHEELGVHMQAADIVAHLRYPTARETSAALLHVLAQGRPTIVSDLEQWADIPRDAVVRVPLDDEEDALTRAIGVLAQSRQERDALGRSATRFIAEAHSARRCREAYLSAIEIAARRPPASPRASWPAHWQIVVP